MSQEIFTNGKKNPLFALNSYWLVFPTKVQCQFCSLVKCHQSTECWEEGIESHKCDLLRRTAQFSANCTEFSTKRKHVNFGPCVAVIVAVRSVNLFNGKGRGYQNKCVICVGAQFKALTLSCSSSVSPHRECLIFLVLTETGVLMKQSRIEMSQT